MTSQVKVDAHCVDTKEVVVRVFNVKTDQLIEEFALQNGESREVLIYDDRAVATYERLKDETVDPEVGVPAAILK
jgi:hypothetical protein